MIAWSYSALTAFELCGKKYAAERVYKTVKEPMGEAMIYGQSVHKALEMRVKTGAPLPDYLQYLEPTIATLMKAGKCTAEQRYAFDSSMRETEYFDKPSTPPDRKVWLRIVIDLQVEPGGKVAILIDHKTGKVKEDLDQLELFAAVMFNLHPELEEVRTGYLWTADNKIAPKTFHKEEVPVIWKKFLTRVERLEHAHKTDTWLPNPSGICVKHCLVSGCPFHGKGNR